MFCIHNQCSVLTNITVHRVNISAIQDFLSNMRNISCDLYIKRHDIHLHFCATYATYVSFIYLFTKWEACKLTTITL